MPLPDFFVIGAPKSGTTALYDCLTQHPGIFMSPVKEPRYFLTDGTPPELQPGPAGSYYRRGTIWRSADYVQLFAAAQKRQKKGEATPAYLRSPESAHRINKNLPDARIIALLRQPAERAYSHYLYMVQHNIETSRTFQEALAAEPARIEQNWFSGLYYQTTGLYGRQLQVWYDLFPRDHIKITLYEDWNTDPQTVLADIFRFLEVDPNFQPALRRSNVTRVPRSRRLNHVACHPERVAKKLGCSPSAPLCRASAAFLQWLNEKYNLAAPQPLASALRQSLTVEYREDILSLQELIGRDLSHWL